MALERLTRTLAALFMPLAVLSSAHELYLRNQEGFDRTVSVLHSFWAVAAVAFVLTLVLQRSGRFALARLALAIAYTLGLAFVGWSFLRALPAGAHLLRWILDTGIGASLFGAASIAATALVVRAGVRRLEPFIAVLAVAFAVREGVSFAMRAERRQPPAPRDVVSEIGPEVGARPNVYHFLLDALQDELIEPCWPRDQAGVLDGFVRFHLRSPRRSTLNVLPAIFSGRWIGEARAHDRLSEALLGEPSLLRGLKQAGYRTAAFVPNLFYPQHLTAFDLAIVHQQNVPEVDLASLHAVDFLGLWVYSILPQSLVGRLASASLPGIGAEFFRMHDLERPTARAQPIVSRMSLERLLALEPRLPARGRYTFVHLLVPHNPHVLGSDCAYVGTTSRPLGTDLKQQTECALLLVSRFLETLHRLERLRESVVVVHGDHGSGFVIRDGRLVGEDDAWLRSGLLIKPAGARGTVRVVATPARLVDIAPTLLATVGAPPRSGFDGRVLEEVRPGP